MKASVLALSLTMTLAMTACSTMTKSPEEMTRTRQSVLGSWTLEKASALPEVPANILVTLHPDNNSKNNNELGVSGFSGVNHFVGSATIDWEKQKLVLSPLASTRMMGPEPRMQFEQAFLKQMEQVEKFRLEDGGKLILLTRAGEKIVFQSGTQ
ncbi:MAG: META domain-containing protein [bacterium]|nr:META domain-containing protein [bacterium]